LDLYLTTISPQLLPSLDLVASAVAAPVAGLLSRSPPMVERHGTEIPVWMSGKRRRTG
jgi:hypothetical protein